MYYSHEYIPEPKTYIDSNNILLAAVLFILLVGLWIYTYAKSKKPKFDRRGHPIHLPNYANIVDLSKFDPFFITDLPIKNGVYDVYDPTTYKLGDTSVFIAYFDGENRSAPNDSPGTYPRMVKKFPIEGILTHVHSDNTDKLRLQYITHLYDDNTEIAHYFAENAIRTIKTIMKKYKIHSKEIRDVNVDIHTNPWKFRTRFNCVDRWSVVLNGTKEILLFNIKRPSKQDTHLHSHINNIKNILTQISESDLSEAQNYLNGCGIKSQHVTLHETDLLYIPAGVFYMETSNLNKPHTVTLNLDVSLSPPFSLECQALFDALWSRPFEMLEHYTGVDDLTIR